MRFLTLAMLMFLVGFVGCSGKESSVADTDKGSGKSKTSEGKTPDAPPTPPTPEPPRTANDLDLTYITADFTAAVIVDVNRLLKSPSLAGLELDDLAGKVVAELGVDPRDLKQVLILVEDQMAGGNAEPSAVLRLNKPVDVHALVNRFLESPEERKTPEGATYYVGTPIQLGEEGASVPFDESDGKEKGGCGDDFDKGFDDESGGVGEGPDGGFGPGFPELPELAVHAPNETTILVGPETSLLKMIGAKDVKSPLTEELRYVDVANDFVGVYILPESVRSMAAFMLPTMKEQIPAEYAEYAPALDLPAKVQLATLTGSLAVGSSVTITVTMADDASAGELEKFTGKGINLGKAALGAFLIQQGIQLTPEAMKVLLAAVDSVGVTKAGRRVSVGVTIPEGIDEAISAAVEKAKAAAEPATSDKDATFNK